MESELAISMVQFIIPKEILALRLRPDLDKNLLSEPKSKRNFKTSFKSILFRLIQPESIKAVLPNRIQIVF